MKFLAFLLFWASSYALALPLQTIGTFCGTFPDQCMKGTESLMAVRGTGTDAYYVLEADPTSGAIPVSATVDIPSVGPTGSAVPSEADYQGLNNGGTLIGAIGDSAGRTIVAGAGTAGTAAGGVVTVQGVASMTPLLVDGSGSTQPVSGTVTASNFPATVDTNSGAVGASTIRMTEGGRPLSGAIVASNDDSSNNITTSAYLQLIASTANAINSMCISDSSGHIIIVATGAAASEIDRIYLPAGGSGCFNFNVPSATRITLKAIDADATSGYFVLTGY